MQSWGTQSRFLVRDTGAEPSKSGIVGLICAAMGTPRDDRTTIERLARLRIAVRADRPGTMAIGAASHDGLDSGRQRLWGKELNVAGDAMTRGVGQALGAFSHSLGQGSSKVTAGLFR